MYEKAGKVHEGITLDMVSKCMGAQPNKETRNYKNYNSYSAPSPKPEFQIDLMDGRSLLRDVDVAKGDQPKLDMVCIDIFGKKLHVVPMNSNDTATVYDALLECFKVLGQLLMIYSDEEGAISSRKVEDLIKAEGDTTL